MDPRDRHQDDDDRRREAADRAERVLGRRPTTDELIASMASAAVARPERLAAVGLADLEAPFRRAHRRRQEANARRARRRELVDDLLTAALALAGAAVLLVIVILLGA